MAELPVPAKIFFSDFAASLLEYRIERSGKIVSTLNGMTNDDSGGDYIAFLYGAEICEGDILIAEEQCTVKKVSVDTYQGKPEMIKEYY